MACLHLPCSEIVLSLVFIGLLFYLKHLLESQEAPANQVFCVLEKCFVLEVSAGLLEEAWPGDFNSIFTVLVKLCLIQP